LKRVLALDYGDRKIGVALSDPMKIIASPLKIIVNSNFKTILVEINDLIKEFNISLILVGIPITMKNTYSQQTNKVIEFVDLLKDNLSIEVKTYDERLTSKMAKKILINQGIKTGHNKQEIDKVSAAIFLQNYLDDPTK
tara:strand:- start:1037 stop:1453 length:417 start_codon:yes stop_codon:yes gene_type:complete